MSVIDTSRLYFGLKVNEETDTLTGKMNLKSTGGTLLASSSDYNWKIEDLETFTRVYNNRAKGIPQLTTAAFEKDFFNNGRPLFNGDRASVIGNVANYTDTKAFQTASLGLFNNKVPGAQNPFTGQFVTNDGFFTDGNPFGIPEGSLTDGFPSNFGYTELPNDALTSLTGDLTGEFGLSGESFLGQDRAKRAAAAKPEYRYPKKGEPVDYIKLTAHKYSAQKQIAGDLLNDQRLGDEVGSVLLPIQSQVAETSGIGWKENKLNFFDATIANTALAGFANVVNAEGGVDIGAATGAMASTLGKGIAKVGTDPNTNAFVRAYFAGQAASIQGLPARATGSIANPNMELLFEGPQLRQFDFQFQLSPRDDDEAAEIRKIIKFLKKNIAPHRTGGKIFLYTPNIFSVEYLLNGGGEHPYLHKFKPCAMTMFTVNYTPTNNYMTYTDGSMVSYQISFKMTEIQPLYQKDQEDQESKDNMGY